MPRPNTTFSVSAKRKTSRGARSNEWRRPMPRAQQRALRTRGSGPPGVEAGGGFRRRTRSTPAATAGRLFDVFSAIEEPVPGAVHLACRAVVACGVREPTVPEVWFSFSICRFGVRMWPFVDRRGSLHNRGSYSGGRIAARRTGASPSPRSGTQSVAFRRACAGRRRMRNPSGPHHFRRPRAPPVLDGDLTRMARHGAVAPPPAGCGPGVIRSGPGRHTNLFSFRGAAVRILPLEQGYLRANRAARVDRSGCWTERRYRDGVRPPDPGPSRRTSNRGGARDFRTPRVLRARSFLPAGKEDTR